MVRHSACEEPAPTSSTTDQRALPLLLLEHCQRYRGSIVSVAITSIAIAVMEILLVVVLIVLSVLIAVAVLPVLS